MIVIMMARLIVLLQRHIVFISFAKWIEFNANHTYFAKTLSNLCTRHALTTWCAFYFIAPFGSFSFSSSECIALFSLLTTLIDERWIVRKVCVCVFANHKMLSINSVVGCKMCGFKNDGNAIWKLNLRGCCWVQREKEKRKERKEMEKTWARMCVVILSHKSNRKCKRMSCILRYNDCELYNCVDCMVQWLISWY